MRKIETNEGFGAREPGRTDDVALLAPNPVQLLRLSQSRMGFENAAAFSAFSLRLVVLLPS